jgi:sugar lactone lactonase YvrE
LLDKNNAIVSKYASEGNIDVDWCSLGSLGHVNGDGEPMLYVNDIAFDSDGNIYIVDQRNYEMPELYKLNSRFELTPGWKTEFDDNAEWELDCNSSVLVYDGYVYIEQDNTNIHVRENRIIRLNSDGKQDLDWEIITSDSIQEMICDSSSHLYLIDNNCMINRYTANGEIDHSWAIEEIPEDSFISGIAMDCNDYLYVCERTYNRITRYTPEGTRDFSWGVGGVIVIPDSGGQYEFFDLLSIAVDDGCNLYISDITSDRILRYGSSGKPDTIWCANGEWRSADGLSNSLSPTLINPTRIKVYEGKLYTVWNDMLYVMRDSLADLGKKIESEPPASEAVTPSVTDNETTVDADTSNKISSWWWVISAGVLIISLVLILRLTKKPSRN